MLICAVDLFPGLCFHFRAGNSIDEIVPEQLEAFQSLEALDLSNNNISELRTALPPLQLKYL